MLSKRLKTAVALLAMIAFAGVGYAESSKKGEKYNPELLPRRGKDYMGARQFTSAFQAFPWEIKGTFKHDDGHLGKFKVGDTIKVVDPGNGLAVVDRISAGMATDPNGVAANPNTNRVYAANRRTNTVSVINAATNTLVTTIDVGTLPEGVVVDTDGDRVFVANVTSSTITVIDGSNNSVLTTITTNVNAARRVAYNAAQSTLAIANRGNGTAVVVVP